MSRALNYRLDPASIRSRRPPASMLLASESQPCDWRAHFPQRRDQGGHGSCESQSWATGIPATLSVAGLSLGFEPSADELYKLMRAIMRAIMRGGSSEDGSFAPLTDSGGEPNAALAAINLYGLRPMKSATVDDGDGYGPRHDDITIDSINREPTFDGLVVDAHTLAVGQISCLTTADIRRVLSAGVMVQIGLMVDSAFMNLAKGQVYEGADERDPDAGGHSTVLAGWTRSGSSYVYYDVNSWGASWCDDGTCLLSEDCVAGRLDAFGVPAKLTRRQS